MRAVSGNSSFNPNAQPCVRKVAGADGVNGTADDDWLRLSRTT